MKLIIDFYTIHIYNSIKTFENSITKTEYCSTKTRIEH